MGQGNEIVRAIRRRQRREVNLVCERVICTETPDNAALEVCRALGKALAEREMMPAADGYLSGGDVMYMKIKASG